MNTPLIPWWKINLTKDENQIISDTLKKRYITQGPLTTELESKFAEIFQMPYTLIATNGSIALLMALMACDIQPGDEVILPNITFIATAQAPLLLGAKVVLVDVEPDRPVMDVQKLKEAITPRTKAIIPVHINGRSVAMRELKTLARKHKIKIIEDAVQSCFSQNDQGYLGTQSDIGVFSLGITKFITAIRGGVLMTRNKSLYNKLKMIRNHGMGEKAAFHSQSSVLGFNFKFNDIFASLGLKQLEKIDQKIQRHQEIYHFYKKNLQNIDGFKMIEVQDEKGELPLWIEAIHPQRDTIIEKLKKHNIQAKPFSPDLCEVPYLKTKKSFQCSQVYTKQGMVLPSGTGQSKKDLMRVIKTLKEIA